jgi:hypothetical protein
MLLDIILIIENKNIKYTSVLTNYKDISQFTKHTFGAKFLTLKIMKNILNFENIKNYFLRHSIVIIVSV